jgi:hypothetical protein
MRSDDHTNYTKPEVGAIYLAAELANEAAREVSPTSNLASDNCFVSFVQFGYRLEFAGILSQESALLEKGQVLVKALLPGELFDLSEQPVMGNAVKRVLNPLALSSQVSFAVTREGGRPTWRSHC